MCCKSDDEVESDDSGADDSELDEQKRSEVKEDARFVLDHVPKNMRIARFCFEQHHL